MRPLVVLDTETATLQGPPHLLEVGAVRVEQGEVVAHLSSLVLPEVPIDPEATAVHGIRDEDVRDAPEAREVLTELCALVGDAWMVAHGARFDARVLGFAYHRAGLPPPPGPVVDTLPLARKALPESPDHRLETLIRLLDLEVEEHHRALPDAVACWQVLEACIDRLGGEAGLGDGSLLAPGGAPLTIAGAGPRISRRLPARLRALERACAAGTAVVLHYGEADSAPAHLPVVPRLLYDGRERAYLEGLCERSGALKTYRLDRIRRVEPAR
jgi:DNA polymerase III epsilon subunit family exonuclease